jgi:hypothetical protein
MNALAENLLKAQQTVSLAAQDIRAAHKAAIRENQFAEILLLDLLTEAIALEKKLNQMVAAAQGT